MTILSTKCVFNIARLSCNESLGPVYGKHMLSMMLQA